MKSWILLAIACCCLIGCQSTDPLQAVNPVSNEVHFTGTYLTPEQVDQAPVVTEQVAPDYPPAASRARLDGKALVTLIVDEQGRPQQVQLIEATHPLFADVSVAAVRHWRFKPAMKDGHAVASQMTLPLEFRRDLDSPQS